MKYVLKQTEFKWVKGEFLGEPVWRLDSPFSDFIIEKYSGFDHPYRVTNTETGLWDSVYKTLKEAKEYVETDHDLTMAALFDMEIEE